MPLSQESIANVVARLREPVWQHNNGSQYTLDAVEMTDLMEQAASIIEHLAHAPESGWAPVPIEPTAEMLQAATMIAPTWDDDVSKRKWRAMLAAAKS